MAVQVNRAKGSANVGAADHSAIGVYDVTADTSYPTGGYTVTFPEAPAKSPVIAVIPISPGTHIPIWDYTAGKLKFWTLAGAEVANATNLTGVSARVVVFFDVGG